MNARIPIELASHEENQLDEFVPRIEERLHEIGLEDEADEVGDVSIINEEDGTFSATTTEWASVIGGLRVLRDDEGLRTWWLRKKLARRVSRKAADLESSEGPTVEAGENTVEEASA